MNPEFGPKIASQKKLISTYSLHAKFDVNVFTNVNTNVAILQYNADIAYTCYKQ